MNTAPQTTICGLCGKALSDPESVKLGIGPDCREKQQQFLSAVGTSLEEIGQLALLNHPNVNRWLRLLARATQDNNRKCAKQFIEAARRAVSLPLICEAEAA